MRAFLAAALDPALPPVDLDELLADCGLPARRDRGPAAECDAGVATYVWLAAALRKRRPVADSARRLILREFRAEVLAAGREIGEAFEAGAAVPGYALTVVDATLAGFTRSPRGWLDLRTGDYLPAAPRPPVEAYSVNLPGLYAGMSALHDQRRGRHGDAAG